MIANPPAICYHQAMPKRIAILGASGSIGQTAVRAFPDGRIRFSDIWRIAERTLGGVAATPATGLEAVLAADREARAFAEFAILNAP